MHILRGKLTLLDSTPAVLATWDFFAEKCVATTQRFFITLTSERYNLDLKEVLRSQYQLVWVYLSVY